MIWKKMWINKMTSTSGYRDLSTLSLLCWFIHLQHLSRHILVNSLNLFFSKLWSSSLHTLFRAHTYIEIILKFWINFYLFLCFRETATAVGVVMCGMDPTVLISALIPSTMITENVRCVIQTALEGKLLSSS